MTDEVREAPWAGVDSFLGLALAEPDEILVAALARSEEAGLPAIQVSALHGQMLILLARTVRARRILEVGTLGGYSTIQLARSVEPGGQVVTVEFDPHHHEVARANIEAAGLADVVTLELGGGVEVVEGLVDGKAEPFDLIFVDVSKPINEALFPLALELSHEGTVIVVSMKDLLRETRHLAQVLRDDPTLIATAVQSVGSDGMHGFLVVHVGDRSALT